jgi:hypothetical protein
MEPLNQTPRGWKGDGMHPPFSCLKIGQDFFMAFELKTFHCESSSMSMSLK